MTGFPYLGIVAMDCVTVMATKGTHDMPSKFRQNKAAFSGCIWNKTSQHAVLGLEMKNVFLAESNPWMTWKQSMWAKWNHNKTNFEADKSWVLTFKKNKLFFIM